MERKKICILPNRLMLGGIEKVMIDAIRVLHNEYDIDVICCHKEMDNRVRSALPDNVTVTCRLLPEKGLGKLLSRLPWLSKRAYRKLLGNDYWDHLLVLRPSMENAVFAKRAKNTVLWCHNDHYLHFEGPTLPLKKRIAKFFRRAIYRKYDMIWTVSEPVAKGMADCFGLSNVHPLPNPLNCQTITAQAEKECDIPMDPSKINFIMIGRMSAEKGFHRVLHFMCSNVLPHYPNARLVVIGRDTNDVRVRERVEKLGCSEQVCLLGPKGNPYPYLKQAQFLLCPSSQESFGLVILEAMLLGVRVITTDTVGGIYTTQNGTLGRCVANTNEALCSAIEGYLEDLDTYSYDLEKARQWAEAHDISHFAQTLHTLLQSEKTN